LPFSSPTMNNEADEEVDVRDEVNEQRHVEQDEKRFLNGSSLAQDGEQKKEGGERRLNKNRDVRRAPTRMNARESRREIAIERDQRRGDVDGARQIATRVVNLVAHCRREFESSEGEGNRGPQIKQRQIR